MAKENAAPDGAGGASASGSDKGSARSDGGRSTAREEGGGGGGDDDDEPVSRGLDHTRKSTAQKTREGFAAAREALKQVKEEREAEDGGDEEEGAAGDDDEETGGEGEAGEEGDEPGDDEEAGAADDEEEGGEGEGGEEEGESGDDEIDQKLVVEIPGGREGEKPMKMAAPDQATADRLRELVRGNMRRGDAFKVRDEAEGIRNMADEVRYNVQLDPAGFIEENVRTMDDAIHLARFLVTREGVLTAKMPNGDTFGEYLAALAEHPNSVPSEAELADAARIKRREKVAPRIEAQKKLDQNARAVVRAAFNGIETLAPKDWDDEARGTLMDDVLGDVQRHADANGLRLVDPKIVTSLIQKRLARFGVAPKAKGVKPKGDGKGRDGSKTPSRSGPTARQLTDARDGRRKAAGAGVGAGSPIAGKLTVPEGKDGKKMGLRDRIKWLRTTGLPSLRRSPQG